MKKIQLFLGFLLAAVPFANALIPSPTDCIIDELRPNPSNPHTFYSCTQYGPVLFQCPGELIFSVQLNKCVYNLDSDEDQSSESEEGLESTTDNFTEIPPIESSEENESSEITTIQTTVKPPSPTTSKSIPTSTDKETTTTETTTVVTSTEPSTTTTQKITTTTTTKPSTTTIRTTTKPSTTTTRKTTTTTIRTTTRPPGAIICEPGHIYYPDPTTCSRFYQCANGIPYRFSCPAGLNFNPNINVCDWPWNYPCPL